MKKYILAVVTLAAFAGISFAQVPAAAPAKAEKPAKHAKVVVETFTGNISAIDAATSMITVKDAKGVEKQFTLEAAKLAGLAAGQKVKVTVKDGKASVKAIQKHEGKHEGKKAEAKKPEAAGK